MQGRKGKEPYSVGLQQQLLFKAQLPTSFSEQKQITERETIYFVPMITKSKIDELAEYLSEGV